MRLDKFLKVSRLVKRRTVAAELCQGGYVQINGQVAKAAAEVREGMMIHIAFGNRQIAVKVLEVPLKAVPAQLAETLYEVLEESPVAPSV